MDIPEMPRADLPKYNIKLWEPTKAEVEAFEVLTRLDDQFRQIHESLDLEMLEITKEKIGG